MEIEKMKCAIDTFVEDCIPALNYNMKNIGGGCDSYPDHIRAIKKKTFGRQKLKKGLIL